MQLYTVLDIIILLALVYFMFIHEYILARRKFKCIRCGRCCRLRVYLSEDEIAKIKKAGYTDFTTGKNKLKKKNGYCVFLTLDNGITSCKLEKNAKPIICRRFPEKRGLFGKKRDMRCSLYWNMDKNTL